MRSVVVILTMTLAVSSFAPRAEAATATSAPPAIELVVDTSGSMNDQDAGHRIHKIDGAKVALLDFIDQTEIGTPVGLRTYPADSSANCDSGQLRMPIRPLRGGTLSSTVRSLTADGGTPTAEAMRAAGRDLTKAGGGTLVLVSDGLSTCADPCKAAKDLAQEGVDFQAITVGFRIDPKGRKELQCIADAFDGKYVDARDSQGLADAVRGAGRPQLKVDLDATTLRATADSPVVIGGTVRNDGVTPAQDVVARIRAADLSSNPGIQRPVQRLGNLDGTVHERRVEWTFRPGGALLPKPGGTRTLAFDVIASATGTGQPASARVTVTVTDADTAAAAGPIIKNRRLAILGDSYSAGEGANDYFPSTRTESNRCHRSRLTYLMPTLRLPDEQLLACSGAVTNDIYEPNEGNHVKAQRDQLSDLQNTGNVDGVVLTLLGNDVQFSTLAKSCLAQLAPCNETVVTNLLKYFLAPPGTDSLWSQSAADFQNSTVGNAVHRWDLEDAIERINSTLNNATVVKRRKSIAPILIPAYPFVVPVTGRSCLAMFGLLSPEEINYVTGFQTELNSQIESATLESRRAGIPVWFVPTTEQAFLPDHTACDGDPYARALNSFDGADPRNTGQDIIDDAGKQDLDDLLETKNGKPIRGSSASAQAKGSALTEGGLLAKAFVAGGLQELVHPNINGYAAETRAIIRWSASPEGRRAAEDLKGFKAVKLLSDWSFEDVGLGQLQPDDDTKLQAGTVYPLTIDNLAPGTQLEVTIHSDRRLLTTLPVAPNGTVDQRVFLPRTIPSGHHTLSLDGVRSNGSPFHRSVAVTVTYPFHFSGAWALGMGALLAALIALVTAGLDKLRRRRSERRVGREA